MIGVVILAAGASRRMGTQKLHLPIWGKPVLQHVIDAAIASAPEEIVVVTSDATGLNRAVSLPPQVRVIENRDSESGQASSP